MPSQNRLVAFSLVITLLALFSWMVHDVAMPVALGGLFAIVLYPLYTRLLKRFAKYRSLVAASIVTAAFLAFVLPLAMVTILGIRTLKREMSGDNLTALREKLTSAINQHLATVRRWLSPFGVDASIDDLQNSITDWLHDAGVWLVNFLGSTLASTPALTIGLFLFVLALFFMLRDGASLVSFIARSLPFWQSDIERLFSSVRDAVRGVVLGSLITGLVQGGCATLALVLFKVPAALLWGVLAFFLSFLPILGTIPVSAGAVLYLFLAGRPAAAFGMMGAGVFIGVSDNLVRPLAQDVSSDMHPLLTLLAIFGGLEAFGAGGLFLGPVIAAVMVWSLQTIARWRGPDIVAPNSPSVIP